MEPDDVLADDDLEGAGGGVSDASGGANTVFHPLP